MHNLQLNNAIMPVNWIFARIGQTLRTRYYCRRGLSRQCISIGLSPTVFYTTTTASTFATFTQPFSPYTFLLKFDVLIAQFIPNFAKLLGVHFQVTFFRYYFRGTLLIHNHPIIVCDLRIKLASTYMYK